MLCAACQLKEEPSMPSSSDRPAGVRQFQAIHWLGMAVAQHGGAKQRTLSLPLELATSS